MAPEGDSIATGSDSELRRIFETNVFGPLRMWGATNGLRQELTPQGTHVVGVLVGMIDTPMSTRWDVPKVSAESVVAQTYEGVVSGALEVLADDTTLMLMGMLNTPAEQLYPALAKDLEAFVP